MKVDLKQLQKVIIKLEKDYTNYIINNSGDDYYKPITSKDEEATLVFSDLLQDLEECFLQFGETYLSNIDKMDKLTKYNISSSYVQTMRWFASLMLRELEDVRYLKSPFKGYFYLLDIYSRLDKCCRSREKRI